MSSVSPAAASRSAALDCAIELEGVTKTFSGTPAVDSLDLVVPTGSIYGFIGPNGSGKTTTLRMILRIYQPDQGVVRVLGQTRGKTADDRLGYLPEERGLYKRMRVNDLLLYYARLKGNDRAQPEIDRWLESLGAMDWKRKRIDTLSKGMAQKVQFVSAVVARPQLLILDEPFSGLDPVNMEALKDAVYRLKQEGTTIVFSTHDMSMAEQMCDTVFMIFQGRKVLDGTLEEIKNQYASDRYRVRLDQGDFPDSIPVEDLVSVGGFWEFTARDRVGSQLLTELNQHASVNHFEALRPSLHDIFVRIARPHQATKNQQDVSA